MEKSVNQRIKFLRESLKISQTDFSGKLQVSQSRIAKIENQKVEVDIALVSHIAYELNVDRNWLLTGEGEMFASQNTSNQNDLKVFTTTVDNTGNESIVLVPERAEAGYLKSFAHEGLMVDFLKTLPVISLPGSEFHNGSFRAFEINGHSMEPTFFVRDIVICRFIEGVEYVRNKEVYVIITKNEGIIIKRAVKKDNNLELHSDNDEFDPYLMSFSEIHEIWKFEARISKFAPMPRKRLKGIEDKLEGIQQQLTLQFTYLNNSNKK